MGPFWTPEKGNREWESSSIYGDDAIFLDANASFTAMGGYCRVDEGDTNCTINVGVYGVKDSNYTLTLTTAGTAGAGQGGSTLLLPGVPAGGALPTGLSDVYNFTVAGLLSPALTALRVTPLGGSSAASGLALFVSQSNARPDPSVPGTYCASATGPAVGNGPNGALVVTIANTSACACVPSPGGACTLYASVVSTAAPGSPDARYTLVGTTSASAYVTLVDGARQDGYGIEGAASLFTFTAELDPPGTPGGGSSAVELVLTPTRGTAQLYVLLAPPGGVTPPVAQPGPSAFTFASGGGSGTQAVSISARDPRFVAACPAYATTPCQLLVAVVTTSVSSGWSVVASSGAYVTLVPGSPVEGGAPDGSVAYYRFAVAQLGQTVVITAAATAGDSSVFVGCDSLNTTIAPVPWDPTSFIWSSQSSGDQVVVIDPSVEPLACASLPCAYYIGIAAADYALNASAGFFIMGRTNGSSSGGGGSAGTPLVMGDALQDYVPGGSCNGYYTPLDPSVPSASIDVYTDAGSVSVYARLDNQTLSPGSYQYAGQQASVGGDGSAGWQSITITSADPAYGPACGQGWPCGISVLVCDNTTGPVTAPTSASSYLVQASASETRLIDAVPFTGTVQGPPAMAYFRYTLPERAPFIVTLTQLSGDADLLMSVGTQPNATWSQWASASPAGEFISVYWTEPWLDPVRNPGLTFPLDFWIGVSGFDGKAEFSLAATSTPYLILEDGVPQAAQAKAGTLTYFLLTLPQPDAFGFEVGYSLVITPISGDAQPLVYGNTVNHTRAACAHCGYPYCRTSPCTPSGVAQYNRHWSSNEQGPLVIEIDTSDPNYETESAYVWAVLVQADSQFTVTATFTDSIARLTNQIPSPGALQAGAYAYYFIDMVNPDVQLSVTLSASAGAPDLFVSVNSTIRRPNATAYSKAAFAGSPGSSSEQALVFTWDELPECPDSSVDHTVFCHAYIGVFADGGLAAEFTLMADAVDVNASEILLLDGVPVTGVLTQGQYGYYYAIVDVPPDRAYSVTLNPYSVAKVDLYATTDGTRPSSTNYAFGSFRANGPEQLLIAPGMAGYNASCVLRVAVLHPFIDIAGFDVTFESHALTTLLPGKPTVGNVQVVPPAPAVQFGRFYALEMRSPSAPSQDEVNIAFTGLSGLDPRLYVGYTSPSNVSAYQPIGAACAVGGAGYAQVVTIKRGDPCFCATPCTYVATVMCPGIPYGEPTCSYQITGTTSSTTPVQLVDGMRLANAVAPGGYRYFSYDMGLLLQGQDNVTVSVFSGSGGVLQLIATNALRGLPTLTTAVWNSNTSGPVGAYASLTIAWNDPAILACPACTLLAVGVYGASAVSQSSVLRGAERALRHSSSLVATSAEVPAVGSSSTPGHSVFALSVSSSAGNDPALRLALGVPSTPQIKAYKTWGYFVVYLTEVTSDLIVQVTPISGKAAVSVDPFSQRPRCYVGPPPTRVIRCDSVWSQPNAALGPIRIAAANPCGSANSSSCDPAAVWRAGPYFITVLSYYSPTQYLVTAYTPDGLVSLLDGIPQGFSTSNSVGGATTLVFTVPPGPAQVPVGFTLSADGFALSFGLSSCVDGTCGSGRPSPANATVTGTVPAQSTVGLSLSSGDAAYCWDPQGVSPCVYMITLLPPPACKGGICAASGTVVAATQAAGAPLEVSWGTVAGAVAVVSGSLPTAAPQVVKTQPSYEAQAATLESPSVSMRTSAGVAAAAPRASVQLYLSPSSAGPVDVAMVLDACGPDTPSLFLCDPSIAGPAGCANPFVPGPAPGANTGANTTAGSAFGRATLSITQTAASVLYIGISDEPLTNVQASGSGNRPRSLAGKTDSTGRHDGVGGTNGKSPLTSGPVTFSLQLSALPSALFLTTAPLSTGGGGGITGAPAPVSVISFAAGALSIAWPQASVASWDGSIARPTVGVSYSVYIAPGGFASSVPFTPIQPLTACGLDRWAQLVAPGVQAVTGMMLPGTDVNSVIISPLPPAPESYYEVAIVASCNSTCLLASGADPTVGSFATLTAAYAFVGLTVTPGSSSTPTPGPGGSDVGMVAAYVAGSAAAVLVLAGAALLVWRRRRNAYDSLSGGSGLGLLRPAGFGADEEDDGAGGGAFGGSGGGGDYVGVDSADGSVMAQGLLAGKQRAGILGSPLALPAAAERPPSRASAPYSDPSSALGSPALPSKSPGLRATRLGQLRASVSVSSPSALPGYAPPASPPLLALDAARHGPGRANATTLPPSPALLPAAALPPTF